MTKAKVIKVTAMQKESLEPLLKEQEIARVGFREASRLLYEAEEKLWIKVRECWPTVKRIKHPTEGKWTVIIDEE